MYVNALLNGTTQTERIVGKCSAWNGQLHTKNERLIENKSDTFRYL